MIVDPDYGWSPGEGALSGGQRGTGGCPPVVGRSGKRRRRGATRVGGSNDHGPDNAYTENEK